MTKVLGVVVPTNIILPGARCGGLSRKAGAERYFNIYYAHDFKEKFLEMLNKSETTQIYPVISGDVTLHLLSEDSAEQDLKTLSKIHGIKNTTFIIKM